MTENLAACVEIPCGAGNNSLFESDVRRTLNVGNNYAGAEVTILTSATKHANLLMMDTGYEWDDNTTSALKIR